MSLVDAKGPVACPAAVARASVALSRGEVVALPTDTVYGLAVAPGAPGATGALFRLKQRPPDVALPVLVADVGQAGAVVAGLSEAAQRLMEAFWPGALTVVVARRRDLGWDLGGSDDSIGLRVPAHPVALALCRAVGPIATTSANRHGSPPLGEPAAVAEAFPEVLVLDAGTCQGQPSTVVDCTDRVPRLLRAGAIPWDELVRATAGKLASPPSMGGSSP